MSEFEFRVHPIDDDPKYEAVIAEAERLAWAELEKSGIYEGFGSCHSFWPVKKRILRERFGVRWKSPSELNPDVIFD